MTTTKRPVKRAAKAPAKTAAKAPAKTATKPAAEKAESKRRSEEDIAKLVPAFVKHLQAGGKMKELKAEYNFSSDHPIRVALAKQGFDAKGNSIDIEAYTGTGKALAKKIETDRQAGVGMYILAIKAGKSETEVKNFLTEHGYDVSGRIYREPAPKPAKAPAKKAPAKGAKAKAVAAEADPSEQG